MAENNPFIPMFEDMIFPGPEMITQYNALGADPTARAPGISAANGGALGTPVGNFPPWMGPILALAGIRAARQRPMGPTARPQIPGPAQVGAQMGAIENQPAFVPSSAQMMGGRQMMNTGIGGAAIVPMPDNFTGMLGRFGPRDQSMIPANTNRAPGAQYESFYRAPDRNRMYSQGQVQEEFPVQEVGNVTPFRDRQGYTPRGGDPNRSHVGQLNGLSDAQFQIYMRAKAEGKTPQEAMALAQGGQNGQ